MPIQTIKLSAGDRADMLVLASALVRADDRPKLMSQLFSAGLLPMGVAGWVLKLQHLVLGEPAVRRFFRWHEEHHPVTAAQLHANVVERVMDDEDGLTQAEVDKLLAYVTLPALEKLAKQRDYQRG